MDKGKPHLRLPRINYIILKETIVVKVIILYNIVMFVKRRLFTFLLLTAFLTGLGYSASKKTAVTVPTKVKSKISQNEDTSKSWYICELKGKTKAGSVVIGPVDHREQILLVWIANSIAPNKDYCIAKNKTYISKNPETFFKDEFAAIKNDIAELGLAEAYEKYFFTNYLTRSTKLTLTDEEQGINNQTTEEEEEAPAQASVKEEAPVEEPQIEEPKIEEEPPAKEAVVEEPAPQKVTVVEQKAPAAEEKKPVVEEKAQVVEPKQPVVEEKAPEVQEKAPVVEEKAPVVQEKAPVVEQTAPVVEQKTPAKTTTTVQTPVNKSTSFLEPLINEDGSYVYNYNPSENKDSTIDADIDLDSLKAELKNELKDELMSELRGELSNYEQKPAVTTPAPAPTPTPTPTPTPAPAPAPVEVTPMEAEPAQEMVQEAPAEVPATVSEAPAEQPAPAAEEAPAESTSTFELPISTSISTPVNRYQRENLLDYAPKKTTALPSDDDEPETVYIAQPDKADSNGCTLLMNAAKTGNERDLRSLILSGANVNLKDKEGWTALMYAVRYQPNETIIETLISAGSNVKEKNKYEVSALSLAATYNENPEILKKLLNYYSPSEKELMQAFILMLTDNSSSDYSKSVKADAFIQKGIALNSFYNGKTPLMYAAQFCTSTTVIRRLLEYGASTSTRSADGKTAWDFAKQNSSLPHDDVYWALNKK